MSNKQKSNAQVRERLNAYIHALRRGKPLPAASEGMSARAEQLRSEMHWENIAKMGYEAFCKQMEAAGVHVGPWENLSVHERIALMAQAQAIWTVISAAITA